MSKNNDALRIIAHADLTNRARGDIAIYLMAWLVIMLPNQIHLSHPGFFYFNSAILALVLLLRLTHYYCFVRKFDIPVNTANNWLVCTILFGALHWGLMSAWVLLNADYAAFEIYIIVTAAVLGLAGTTALSISRRIRLLFPNFMMLPMIATLFARAGTEDLIFGSMAVLSLVYVIVTSKTASQDYWQAIQNHALAEQRASEMERLSVTDQLTQLKNRSYFDQRFGEEWKRGDRQKQPLSLLMLDLDAFKLLNDNHGHVFGDECLRRVARTLDSEIHRENLLKCADQALYTAKDNGRNRYHASIAGVHLVAR
ncbi:MAG: GGDEF domain-containing protein [Gammaproteobacteria bacterium]|nr:GGDEF domain-containing protein [Gammaproteobacteria bacterium]